MFDFINGLSVYAFVAIYFLIALVISICVSVAINLDAKANNIKHRNLWVSFGFFCSLFAGIIYIVSRKSLIKKSLNSSQNNTENQTLATKKNKPVIIALIVVAIVFAVFGNIMQAGYDLESKLDKLYDTTYSDTFLHKSYSPNNTDEFEYFYDMKKNPYIDNYEVIYYDEKGGEYLFEYRADGEGLINIKTSEFHKAEECFVDENGYLIFDDSLYNDELFEYNISVEKDGKTYYWAAYVSWDNMGNMVDSHGMYLNEDYVMDNSNSTN